MKQASKESTEPVLLRANQTWHGAKITVMAKVSG